MTNANKELRINYVLHIVAIVLGILLSVGAAKAETFTVTNTNDMGTGSLRQAIAAANAAATDDTIVFNIPITDSGYSAAADSYTITLGSGQLTIANNGKLVINGLGAKRLSVSGNNASRVFLINENAAVTISRITVTGGLEGEEFVGAGGGIYNGGNLTLTHLTISGNRASEQGGGIFNRSVGTLTMSNSTVAGNRSKFGSGIYNDAGTQTLISSTVSGNGACTLGCGIYNRGSMTLTNSTISGNGQALFGGGILNEDAATATLKNSTVSGNTASGGGGGIRNFGTLSMSDSIIANSGVAGDCANVGEGTVSAGNSLIQDGTGCVNGTNSNNLTGDPMLGPLQDNGGPTLTHALLAGSPAINSGSNALIPAGVATDQRGGFRIVGSTVDMGAFESGAAVFTVNSTADTTPGTGTCEPLTATTNCTLREAMEAANAAATDDTILFNIPTSDAGYSATTDRYTVTLGGHELQIGSSGKLSINGLGATRLTVSGNNQSRVIRAGTSVFKIDGITITGGNGVGNNPANGGGVYNLGNMTLSNSVVSDNTAAARGGGIYTEHGTVLLVNTTVSGNSAGRLGGGISIYSSAITIINSTISSNSAGEGGDGISVSFSTLNIRNSIIANTGSLDCHVSTLNAEYSLIEGGLGCVNGTNSNNVTGDPMLGPLQDNGGPTFTHALVCGSPAINAGSNALAVDAGANALTSDQRGAGFPRIFNSGRVDMGAFELQQTCNTAPTITASAVSRQQAAGSANSTIATVGDADQALDTLIVTIDAGSSSTTNGVTVSNVAVSSGGVVTADVSAACAASNASFTLRVTDNGALFQEATLNVTVTNETTGPMIDPISNVTVYLPLNSTATSMVVTFPLPTATDNCTALPTVTTDPVSGSTFTVGTTVVNVTAKDALNNTSMATFTVSVRFNFGGFLQPVDAFPVVNVAAAGSAIPVKFSLSGNKGLTIMAPGYPRSSPVACDASEPGSTIDETMNAGSSSLTYDAALDRYSYVWKTEKAWKGTCRMLIVRFADGTDHVAKFRFR